MDPQAMDPFGEALLAWLDGDRDGALVIRRDDGYEARLPVGYFFRPPAEFTALERAAIERCTGRVLDAGAGTGLHSLALQEAGRQVTAIDVSAAAVEVMIRRGVRDARCADLLACDLGPFDTVLMMGHGIGMVETIAGLDRFLNGARRLLSDEGQVLIESMDVRATDDPRHLAYHEANRRAGRYAGEIRLQAVWKDRAGAVYPWLLVDADTLADHAASAGWRSEIVLSGEHGDYLARLSRGR